MPTNKEAEKPLCLWTFPSIKFIFPFSFAKYALFQKLFQIKVVKHSISYQKISGRISLSPPGGEVGTSKDWHFQNIAMYKMFVLPPYEKTGNHTDNGEFWYQG